MQILHLASVKPRPAERQSVRRAPLRPFAALDLRVPFIHREGAKKMLWTLCLVLLVLWALGMATSYTAGGLIHILLVVGLVILVFRLIQ